jgi:membrane protein YqaA with SNARE-associated domain
MLRTVYDRVLALSASRKAPLWLAAVAFAESSFFPVPPDALLIPMVLARPERAWRFALICTIMSVLGGIAGYYIGYALFEPASGVLQHFFDVTRAVEQFRDWFQRWGLAVILIKGLTFIPYKFVTIAAGVAHFDFPLFVAASVLTRGGRFFLVAFLLRRFGPPVQAFVEQRLTLVTSVVAAGIVLAFVAFRYV